MGAKGLTISVTVRDCIGTPIPGILPSDTWLIGCSNLLELCGGAGAINASAPTDINGQTTITAAFAAGGCDVGGLRLVVQGVIMPGAQCGVPCIPIKVKSVDITGNLLVDLADFAALGAGYTSPPQPYNECLDFWTPYGVVDLADFAKWALHYQHIC
ncbi:MAG: hypothetical protein L0Z51_05890 [Candidatus Latescibacteria bacterium]|nr:hypothetical protein [Candidatus Latescibacterota bacterium]